MNHVNLEYEGQLTFTEDMMARRAIEVLHRHYPGHPWGVSIDAAMLVIKHKNFGHWGFRINMLLFTESMLDREIVKAGGECLERFSQPRGRADGDRMSAHPKDSRGVMVPDRG